MRYRSCWIPGVVLLAGCGSGADPRPATQSPPMIETDFPEPHPSRTPAPPQQVSAPREPADPAPLPPPRREADPADLPASGPSMEDFLRELSRDPERLHRELKGTPLPPAADANARLQRDLLETCLLAALGENVEAHAALSRAEGALRTFCPIEIRNLCLTSGKPAGYGSPDRLDKPSFRAVDVLNVYFEIDRVAQARLRDRYLTQLDVDLSLVGFDGRPVEGFDAVEKELRLRDRHHESKRPHTDFYFHLTGLRLPKSLAPGRYTLFVRCEDGEKPKTRSAQASVEFEITR